MYDLHSLGWTPYFQNQLQQHVPDDRTSLFPARVSEEHRGSFRLLCAEGEVHAQLAGRLRHAASLGGELPTTGDWVLAASAGDDLAMIHHVLERRTKIARLSAGERTVKQIVAANVDVIFVVQSLNRDLNLRRLERTLALVWESGARPVVVLSKADLCDDPDPLAAEVEAAAPGVPVHVVSAVVDGGLSPIEPYLDPGITVALIGSSGVGKSTIVNALAGEERVRVASIRDSDDRGRHTTTSRELIPLRSGALLLDTPGMRTMLMLAADAGLARAFDDIEALGAMCRFGDCAHGAEPGCAVREALSDGSLDAARYRSYLKLQREMRYAAGKQDVAVRLAETKRWKRIHREARARPDKRRA